MSSVNIYFDRRTLKDGKAQVKISVSRNGSTAYIPTGVWLLPDQWRRGKVTGVPAKRSLQAHIDSLKARVEGMMAEMRMTGRMAGMDATAIKNRIMRELEPPEDEGRSPYGRMVRYARGCRARRTREMYLLTAKRMREYDPDIGRKAFEDIGKEWLSDFVRFLCCAPNSAAIHLRNLRAVFNDAIDNGITAHYPFRTFKIKTQETPKKALSPDEMRCLLTYTGGDEALRYHLDYFLLSFFLIGINLADMAVLGGIRNGRIEYRRQKTGRLYSVKVEREAMEIIERHRGRDGRLLDILDCYANVHSFTVAINKHLKRILPGLTSYHARHTWATAAAAIDIPADTISRALGHSFLTGAAVTAIYIDFSRSKVDTANRLVIDAVMALKGRQ